MSTYTLTFGDVAENHRGMQEIGTRRTHGFSIEELSEKSLLFTNVDHYTLDIYGYSPASLLVIRQGVDQMFGGGSRDSGYADHLLEEQKGLPYDTQALMYGRVVNKKARHNLCFSDFSQEPDYTSGKGRVIHFKDLPYLNSLRQKLMEVFAVGDLQGEGNYYYNITKCGIGYHGDTERRVVIGVRLGETLPLCYQWYYQNKKIGERMYFELTHGDIYVMSEKAVGYDWKRKSIYTLRHAAGAPMYID